MRSIFGFSLKQAVTAALVSCFIASGVAEMTSPSVASKGEAVTISVDRANKGDRLPQASLPNNLPNNSTSTGMAPASPNGAPLGCDPAFSSIADPARAHIFKRCTV
jgi:hypothetical protein